MDEVDAKIVVAGISTTCSQKIHNRLEWAAVGLEQGGNEVAGSSGTLSGNKRLPGSVLLTRERLLERLRRMPHSEQAWQEEVDCAHQGQRDAEGKLSSLEEHMELEKRYRELTDLLVGCRMHVQITRIDEAKNDLVLSEKEAWVSWIY